MVGVKLLFWGKIPTLLLILVCSASLVAQPVLVSNIDPVGKAWAEVVNATEQFPESRHEASYIEFGGKFYLLGGRGIRALNIFNPETKTWTVGAPVPGNKELHHFQAVVFQNKIYIIGAFTHWFPEERPVGDVYIYDPVFNKWTVKKDAIPVDRRRGATGAVVYKNKIYLVGGIINGHTDGWVNWVDSYDPITGAWTKLANAPHERDHFQAALIGTKIFAIGGRKTSFTSLLADTEPAVDVYDIISDSWTTLPEAADLPTQRAGNAAIVIDNKILIAGGESATSGAHPEVELFDPAKGQWTELPSLITGRHGTQPVLYKGQVFLASGWGYTGSNGDELQTQEFISLVDEEPGSVPQLIKPIPNQIARIGSGDFGISLAPFFADDNGIGNLTFTVTYISGTTLVNTTFIDGDHLSINIKPGKTGNTSLRVRATDNAGFFVEDEFIVTILPLAASAPKVEEALPDRKIAVNNGGLTINLTDVFSDDMPFDSLNITISKLTDSVLVSKAVISGNELKISFPQNLTGIADITIRATDKDSLFVEDQFRIEVISKTQSAPKVKTPLTDFKVKINEPARAVSLKSVFSDDQPQEELTYKIIDNDYQDLVEATIENDSLILNFAAFTTGYAAITIRATDADGQYAEDFFKVLIYQPDSVPVYSLKISSGNDSVNYKGNWWIADRYFEGGEKYTDRVPVSGTDMEKIYQSERYGDFSYAIPVPAGSYNLKLHFSEIYWTETGKRIFNAGVENNQASLKNFDILKAAGAPARAIAMSFDSIIVKDDTLNLSFQSVIDNAKLSGIEITSTQKMLINNPPFVALAVADQELKFGEKTKDVNIYKVFYDDDGSVLLKLSVDYIGDTSLISSAQITGVTLKLNAAPGKSGKTMVRIKATDKEGLTATEEFMVTIGEPAPEAPVVYLPLKDIKTGINVPVAGIKLDSVFRDNRGPAQLILKVSKNSNPSIVTAAVIKNGILALTLARNKTGSSTITLRATDIDGLYAEDNFVVTIAAQDSLPSARILINAGGDTVDLKGQKWQADNYFTGGSAYVYSDSIFASENKVNTTERFGNYGYSIPLPNGSYTVRLYFVELFWSRRGERVFNVNVENRQALLNNYDIIKKSGAAGKLITEEFRDINVKDSLLNIDFVSVVDNAKITGIEVFTTPVIAARTMPEVESASRTTATSTFKVYPNPVTGRNVTVVVPADFTDAKSQLSLYNLNGSLVYRIPEIKLQGRQFTLQLPSQLSKGTYMIQLNQEGRNILSKLIIQ